MDIDSPVAMGLRLCRSLDEFDIPSHNLQAAHTRSALHIDLDRVPKARRRRVCCTHRPVLELWPPRCLARSARGKHLDKALPPVIRLIITLAACQQSLKNVEAVVLVVPLTHYLLELVHEDGIAGLQHSVYTSALMLVLRNFHELTTILISQCPSTRTTESHYVEHSRICASLTCSS